LSDPPVTLRVFQDFIQNHQIVWSGAHLSGSICEDPIDSFPELDSPSISDSCIFGLRI
jgi:hypothetical protein